MSAADLAKKYSAFCGKVYDFTAKRIGLKIEETPEAQRQSRTRGTWMVSLFVVALMVVGAVTEEDESQSEIAYSAVSGEDATIVSSVSHSEQSRTTLQKTVPSSQPDTSPLRVYCCDGCSTTVTAMNIPRPTKCPGHTQSRVHHWSEVGFAGDETFQCGKCGASCRIKGWVPRGGRCPKGEYHSWSHL